MTGPLLALWTRLPDPARRVAPFGFPFLLGLVTYHLGLACWYQMDDFAWLSQSKRLAAGAPLSLLLFEPTAHGTWRPLTDRANFLIFATLFGQNALPFRVFLFLLQLANVWLMVKIFQRLTGSLALGSAAAVFWMANPNLVTVMTWPSAHMQAVCLLFMLSALWLLLRHLDTGLWRYYWGQWLVFLAGFTAMETNLVYPVLALGAVWLVAPALWRRVIPLFAASVVFAGLHMWLIPKQRVGTYAQTFQPVPVARSLGRYWEAAIYPENLGALTYIPDWIGYVLLVVVSAALCVYLSGCARRREWGPWFGVVWFLATLAPVLPMTGQFQRYYLSIPAVGLGFVMASLLTKAAAGRTGLRVAVAALSLATLVIWIPSAMGATQWWYARSQETRRLLGSLVRHRDQAPGKTIVVTDVDNDTFWRSLEPNALTWLDLQSVRIDPASRENIRIPPTLMEAADAFADLYTLCWQLAENSVRIVSARAPTRDLTAQRRRLMLSHCAQRLPTRIDLLDPRFDPLLGPGWGPAEPTQRWMGAEASIRMAAPLTSGAGLFIRGYTPAVLLAKGPLTLEVKADGILLGRRELNEPDQLFHADFALDRGLVGKPEMTVELRVDRVHEGRYGLIILEMRLR